MKRLILILLAIGALVSAQPASAQGSSSNPGPQGAVARLESRVAALDSKLAGMRVPQGRGDSDLAIQRNRIRAERQQLRDLIEKIQTGQHVSPAEIDRAFGTKN
jgi:Spy/CpxP family protein refolding chaperone